MEENSSFGGEARNLTLLPQQTTVPLVLNPQMLSKLEPTKENSPISAWRGVRASVAVELLPQDAARKHKHRATSRASLLY